MTIQEHAHACWQALLAAVRASTLYDPGHVRIRELAAVHARAALLALGPADRFDLELSAEGVLLDEQVVHSADGVDADLTRRLLGEGLRIFTFRPGYGVETAIRLVEAMGPYLGLNRPPEQPLSDRLRWESLPGLTLVVDEVSIRTDVEVDALTLGERAWRRLCVQADPGVGDPAPTDSLRPVWDLRGGIVQWPAPDPEGDRSSLEGEVERADRHGAPMSRVGMIVGEVAQAWRDDPRLDDLMRVLPDRVAPLLREHRPGEVARLLAPLRRWAAELPPDADRARAAFDACREALLEDRMLSLLLASVAARAVEPSRAAAYFAGTASARPLRVLEFAAALPEGPYREAVMRVLRNDLSLDPAPLEEAIERAPIGTAAVAFDLLASLPPSPRRLEIALALADGEEEGLRARALRYLEQYDDAGVAYRMERMLDGPPADRSVALAYFIRNPRPSVFGALVRLVHDPRFDGLSMVEQVEIARALGFSDPGRGAQLALQMLGPGWLSRPARRTAPWVVGLAAAAAPEASEALMQLARSAPELGSFVLEASRLWARRRAELGAGEPRAKPEVAPPPSSPRPFEPRAVPTPGRMRVASRPGRPDVGEVVETDGEFGRGRHKRAFEVALEQALSDASYQDWASEGASDGDDSGVGGPDNREIVELLESLEPVALTEILIEDASLEFDITGSGSMTTRELEALKKELSGGGR